MALPIQRHRCQRLVKLSTRTLALFKSASASRQASIWTSASNPSTTDSTHRLRASPPSWRFQVRPPRPTATTTRTTPCRQTHTAWDITTTHRHRTTPWLATHAAVSPSLPCWVTRYLIIRSSLPLCSPTEGRTILLSMVSAWTGSFSPALSELLPIFLNCWVSGLFKASWGYF